MLARPRTGVETYLYALATGLPVADPGIEWVYVSASPLSLALPRPVLSPPRAMSHAIWRQLYLPRLLRRERVNLFHSPLTAVPLRWSGPIVSTVHDLIWTRYPESYSFRRRCGHRLWNTLSSRVSSRIIVPSRATANDLRDRHAALPEEMISVIPECCPKGRGEKSSPEAASRLLHRLNIAQPFILTVGTIQPRKNIDRLVAAFAGLSSLGSSGHQLVIVGKDGYAANRTHAFGRSSPRAAEIRMVGYLDDHDIEMLYRVSDLFVFPSLYEGFGIPLLEAMRLGTPVASSRASSMPEVGGDAAAYFDPMDVEEMSRVMHRVLTDEALRRDLVRKGFERVKLFTPERMAAATVAVYREVLKEHGRGGD